MHNQQQSAVLEDGKKCASEKRNKNELREYLNAILMKNNATICRNRQSFSGTRCADCLRYSRQIKVAKNRELTYQGNTVYSLFFLVIEFIDHLKLISFN